MPGSRLVITVETVVLILTAALCIGEEQKSQQPVSQRISQSDVPVPTSGQFADLIDIGAGRKMYLKCSGSGSPTVILESGYRNDADIWSTQFVPGNSTTFPEVAKFTRVCAYDRHGKFLYPGHVGRSNAAL